MKNKTKYKALGLMSGTSLDGLDMAYCEFINDQQKWNFNLIKAETVAYPGNLSDALSRSTDLSSTDLFELDHTLGKWMGQQVKEFIQKDQLDIDFIASHGHTVFHQPDRGFTLQIGNGNDIAFLTGQRIINDFRSLDVAAGGEGAPLVPVGDACLFHDYEFCLNLGGIANVSFDKEKGRLAFDIGPCNMILNYLAGKIDLAYDSQGNKARSGEIISPLLQQFNALAYYQQAAPKSLGYEWVQANFFSALDMDKYKIEDLLCTCVEHVALQIAHAINKIVSGRSRLLVTGGGAFNTYLMERLNVHLSEQLEVVIPNSEIVSFKEAIIFGFMGVLRVRNEVNCLASVTGAQRDVCAGVIIDGSQV